MSIGSRRESFAALGLEFFLTAARCVCADTGPTNTTPSSAASVTRRIRQVILWSKRATNVRFKYQMMLFQRRHEAFCLQLPPGLIDGDRVRCRYEVFMCIHRER